MGLSPQHFARLFKATYGTTPHQYVQRLRIEAAVEALRRDPAVPLGEVALSCGFASHSELMRRRLGVRPSTCGAMRSPGNGRFDRAAERTVCIPSPREAGL